VTKCTMHGAAHGHDAARPGWCFIRMHRTANDGTDTISADQHVAVCDSTAGPENPNISNVTKTNVFISSSSNL